MFVTHLFGLFTHPDSEWAAIARQRHSLLGVLAGHVIPLALLPALAWYWGVTRIGWTLPGGDTLYRMTPDSTVVIIALFYWAMVVGTVGLGFMVHWMARTYGSTASLADALSLAAYTNTPLFLLGVIGLKPSLWIDLVVGTGGACFAVYLLYTGIPHMMGVSRERGYLFASAALAVALVMLIAMMGATVMLWELGAMPVFTD
ncbi:MAG TPA: Yip1 family protein [Pseudomonadales bacterium]|nr:Yip1 family protein [Pseudomonadales bacterium]